MDVFGVCGRGNVLQGSGKTQHPEAGLGWEQALAVLTLKLLWQCKTEEELVAALQEAEDHPDACAPACMPPCHTHALSAADLGACTRVQP